MTTLRDISLKVDVKKATPKPDQMAMMMGRGMRGGRGGPRGKLSFVPTLLKTYFSHSISLRHVQFFFNLLN